MRGRSDDLLVQVSDQLHTLQRVLGHASLALMIFSTGYLAGVPFQLSGRARVERRSVCLWALTLITFASISSGCDMGIYVDGKLAAKLGTKERVTFKIPAGEVVLGAGVIGSGLCGTAADRREREVTLGAGQDKNYQVFISSEADVDILPSTL